MKAFVFVDRLGDELAPLNDQYCVAMLPLAGKPVVAYTIDELARAGIREAVIIACRGARDVSDYLGNGERWGMAFEYFPSRGEESPAELLTRFGQLPQDPFLVLRGDVLRSGTALFLEQAAALPASVINCRIDSADAGLCLCRDRGAISALALPFSGAPVGDMPYSVVLDGARYAALDGLADVHRAALDLAEGRFEGVSLAGWQRRPGLIVGPGSVVEDNAVDAEYAYIGKCCRVHRKTELRGTVVIDDTSFIDRSARIKDSVIFPGTYVGEKLDVTNALVCGQQIFRADSGVSFTVTDPFLLSTMKSDALWTLLKALGNRLAGLLTLLLSVPLWPLAALAAVWHKGRHPLAYQTYLSNKRIMEPGLGWRTQSFKGWQWQVQAPVLRYLPLLLDVVAGHLNLWGACPRVLHEEQPEIAPGQRVEHVVSAGLLGPVQIMLPLDAPPEERLLSEIQYSYEQSVRQRLWYLRKGLAALFSARAWRPLPMMSESLAD